MIAGAVTIALALGPAVVVWRAGETRTSLDLLRGENADLLRRVAELEQEVARARATTARLDGQVAAIEASPMPRTLVFSTRLVSRSVSSRVVVRSSASPYPSPSPSPTPSPCVPAVSCPRVLLP